MALFGYTFPIILILLCMMRPKSKLLCVVVISYICALIAFNTQSYDRENYEFMYRFIDLDIYSAFEPLSVLLMKICSHFDLTFYEYRLVVSVIFGIFLLLGIIRLTNNVALASVIALIYPCVGYASGLRQSIAFSISTLAFSYLFTHNKNGRRVFASLIIVATLFHYSAMVNFIFLLYKRMRKNTNYILCLFLYLIVFMLYLHSIIFLICSEVMPNAKILTWLNPSYFPHPTYKAAFIFVIIDIVCLFMLYNYGHHNKQYPFSIYRSMVKLSFFLVPFLIINMNYERMIAYVLFAILCRFINTTAISSKKPLYIMKKSIIAMGIVFVMNIVYYLVGHNNLYFPLLINNLMFL